MATVLNSYKQRHAELVGVLGGVSTKWDCFEHALIVNDVPHQVMAVNKTPLNSRDLRFVASAYTTIVALSELVEQLICELDELEGRSDV